MRALGTIGLLPAAAVLAAALLISALLAAASVGAAADESAPPRAAPKEVDAFLDAWATKSKEIRSLTMRFRQEKRMKILRRPKTSEGDLAYADGRLSVVVRSPAGEVETELLLAEGELKILYPRLQRLEVIPLGKSSGPGPPVGMGPSIPFFAGDPRDAKKDYEIELVRAEKEDRLALIPRDAKSPVKRLELVFVDFALKEYRQVDANGDDVRMQVIASEVNPRVPSSRFEMHPPPGTVVVHPTGEKPGATAPSAKKE